MKITLELSDGDVSDACRFTGVSTEGPAIHKLLTDALALCREVEATRRCVRGGWGPERDRELERHALRDMPSGIPAEGW